MKPYIQPFERRLALEELRSLSGDEPRHVGNRESTQYSVRSRRLPNHLADHLAYWEQVTSRSHLLQTRQVLREATVNVVRNGVALDALARALPFGAQVPVPNRRCLRYGPHGIHEYRGKFFPQLVRSLLNAAEVPAEGVVADPMCGSGTSLVETILSGRHALGLDMNPLSVLMTRTKCALMTVKPAELVRSYESVRSDLLRSIPGRISPSSYTKSLPDPDQEYLRRWFSREVLTDLDQVAAAIQSVKTEAIRDLMRLSLSNVLRRVSWQKDDDLRVRKQVRLDAEIDAIREFLDELGKSVRAVLALLYQNAGTPVGAFEVVEGDARDPLRTWKARAGSVDAIITSPPYATALPYLDTDRLSLIYLQLLTRPQHRTKDSEMIGNREISNAQRSTYEDALRTKQAEVPEAVGKLIGRIVRLNSKVDVGFRRRNLPALLSKYFSDMGSVFDSAFRLLKPGGRAYVVVGSNHTVAGGTRVEIDTPALLAQSAEMAGFALGDTIRMEMLSSRDIFRKNTGSSEVILNLQKPRR